MHLGQIKTILSFYSNYRMTHAERKQILINFPVKMESKLRLAQNSMLDRLTEKK